MRPSLVKRLPASGVLALLCGDTGVEVSPVRFGVGRTLGERGSLMSDFVYVPLTWRFPVKEK